MISVAGYAGIFAGMLGWYFESVDRGYFAGIRWVSGGYVLWGLRGYFFLGQLCVDSVCPCFAVVPALLMLLFTM